MGRGAQLRRRRRPARCASSSSPTPATGSTSSTSTACASTRRSRSTTPRPTHILAAIGRRVREAARRPGDLHRRRERAAARRAGAARRSRAATASTRCGTTTSTTRAMVALTGHNEAYYTDYRGTPAGVHLGRRSGATSTRASATLAEEAARHAGARTCRRRAFVNFLENHDQVANSARGQRLHRADQPRPLPGDDGAAAAGAGHADAVPGPGVRCVAARSSTSPITSPSWPSWSRRAGPSSWRSFPAWPRRTSQAQLARPGRSARRSSAASSTWPSAKSHAAAYALHRDLLRLRREDPVFRRAAAARHRRRGAGAGGVRAALLRRTTADDRLLLVNLGRDLHLDPAPEPLLAPPAGQAWRRALVERGPALRRLRHAAARD